MKTSITRAKDNRPTVLMQPYCPSEQRIIAIIGVGEINFETAPNQFVLKMQANSIIYQRTGFNDRPKFCSSFIKPFEIGPRLWPIYLGDTLGDVRRVE